MNTAVRNQTLKWIGVQFRNFLMDTSNQRK